MKSIFQIDYLVIGHVSRDIVPGGYVPGGTAVYASLAAQALGCRTAVVTSLDQDYDIESILDGINVQRVPARESTVFENLTDGSVRRQRVLGLANKIGAEDVPSEWQRASIVHIGPIAGEIAPDLIRQFSNSLVGITPQGWFRRWDSAGHVFATEWPHAPAVFPLASAVIASSEDLPSATYLDKLRLLTSVLVLTHGERGCTVYSRDEVRSFAAPSVKLVNSTGAGDIFAAAFLIRLYQTNGNPWEAAAFANDIAARSVCGNDLGAKVGAIEAYFQAQS